MEIKKIAASAATAGVLGLGGLGLGMGFAHADPHGPGPQPIPGHSENNDNRGPGQWPTTVTGPGVNAGTPGNPLPPGHGFLPPPGHYGPMPADNVYYPDVPSWVLNPVPIDQLPVGIPPAPELPDWVSDLPNPADAKLVFNTDLNAWGIWNGASSTFIRL
ncbi:hypothetical protein [Mycolicibacterium rhodesiae]|uniref:Uncharacterized protein n=1 Tax=Mycolicibacterium rhodesiae TaxID=36814 RepID=A0A1X0J662_MYCRH|nr:hypothetical protein [Mycolicibacterium rhodesiae]MCV7344413.1 hypothetical protein [Mycolicibacterium rhodesiae]ORB57514.1 hypothetical protein BST42_03955 [Mycolicibacterium rhodesiae]